MAMYLLFVCVAALEFATKAVQTLQMVMFLLATLATYALLVNLLRSRAVGSRLSITVGAVGATCSSLVRTISVGHPQY